LGGCGLVLPFELVAEDAVFVDIGAEDEVGGLSFHEEVP